MNMFAKGVPTPNINPAEVRRIRISDKAVRKLFMGREAKPHGVAGWKRSFLRNGRERRRKNEKLRSVIWVGELFGKMMRVVHLELA